MYNLTDWFSGEELPIRHGVYEKEIKEDIKANSKYLYSYWNGEFWGYSCATIEQAVINKYRRSLWQKTRWRGLNGRPTLV